MTNHKNSSLTKQEQFMLAHKAHHHQVSLCRFFIFFSFLFLWEWSARRGWIDAFFFSSPSRVVRCFREQLLGNRLLLHIGVTLYETLFSFLFVLFFSLISATLLWSSGKLSEITEPYLVILNSLPKSALAPLLLSGWAQEPQPLLSPVCLLPCLVPLSVSIPDFSRWDAEKLILIQTLGGRKRDAFFKVVLPGSVPTLLSTAKVNIGLALVGVIIGEFLAARRGLGYLIIYGSQVFQLDMVITAILILCLIAFAFYKSIQVMEHRLKSRFL